MRKEELITLGLDEKAAEKVAAASAEELKGFIPKARFDEVNTAKNDYEKQTKEYVAKIDELTKSARSTDELKAQFETAKAEYAKKETEYQTKIKETAMNSALKMALNGKVHDVDVAAMLIDKSKLELDDKGNISKGLDDQLKSLKESKAFLFVPEKPNPNPQPPIKFGNPDKDKTPPQPSAYSDYVAMAMAGQKQ